MGQRGVDRNNYLTDLNKYNTELVRVKLNFSLFYRNSECYSSIRDSNPNVTKNLAGNSIGFEAASHHRHLGGGLDACSDRGFSAAHWLRRSRQSSTQLGSSPHDQDLLSHQLLCLRIKVCRILLLGNL